jgi:hypothetical protein
MGIADMSLGLPEDIDADVSTIESKCDTLDRICSTMMGRAHDTDGHFHDAAGEFTSAVAWDLSSASAAELAKWEEASGSLTYGAATLRMWAEDIETYRSTREELKERWETAKSSAQFRVDNPVLSNPLDPLGGLVESWLADQEAAEVEALEEVRAQLLGEHSTAWNTLMDQAEQTEKDLRDGPSTESLERMIDAGHLGWRHIGLFPPDNPPPLTEEEGTEAADELESYLEDPEGYEGNIAEVLAMLTLVTGNGPSYQNNGGQPPADHMDFLEAFYEGFEDTLINIDGPRGVLGAVDLLENGEGIDDEIRTGFLNSMGEGLMMLSDESLFGGYDRLPESVRRAAEGPSLMDPDQFEHYDLNTWSSEVGALETLLSSASPDMRAGVDLSATLTLSMGHYAGGGENAVGAWVGEEDTLSLVEIASRNHDAMHDIFTGEYEHPNFVGEDGEFKENAVDTTHQGVINRAIEGLYTHEWSDDGETLRNMTDWIAEEADSDDPYEVSRSEKAFIGLVDTFTSDYMLEALSSTGHDVEDTLNVENHNGEQEETTFNWKNVSMGHLNPEVADSMAGIFETYIDAFADDEIMDVEDKVDPSVETGHNGPGDYNLTLGDRRDFIQLISGSSDAFERVVEASAEYTNNSLQSYVNTHSGDPSVNHAMRTGLLWNAVETGFAGEVGSRIENHSDELKTDTSQRAFAADMVATFIPQTQAAEAFKFVTKEIVEQVVDEQFMGEQELTELAGIPDAVTEAEVQILVMESLENHEGWGDSGNSEGRADRQQDFNDIRNEPWPGSDNGLLVGDVVGDFVGTFGAGYGAQRTE